MHVNEKGDISLPYFFLPQINDIDALLKIVEDVVDDISLWIDEDPSNMFVFI